MSFGQIGIIALVYQSRLRCSSPGSACTQTSIPSHTCFPSGMGMTFIGIAFLAGQQLRDAVGCGSGGGRRLCYFSPRGLADCQAGVGWQVWNSAIHFQVGGNTGSAIGPLLTAAIVIPHGQPTVAWFMVVTGSDLLFLYRPHDLGTSSGTAKAKVLSKAMARGWTALA